MISPTRCFAANSNIVDRVIDVRWIDAKRIKGEAYPRGIADMWHQPRRDEETNRAGNLSNAGQEYDLLGKGHPVRGDGHKPGWALDMRDTGDQVKGREQEAEEPANYCLRNR
ncbi:hypothetical protein GCM10009096_10870 [Parasphingorhabdus litoris]|uniref:Uncharacterized protein n=1 Tax=Parasphingorhabdus litoris TaxID=394733 RepID=A0ABN1AAH7_9SPHN